MQVVLWREVPVREQALAQAQVPEPGRVQELGLGQVPELGQVPAQEQVPEWSLSRKQVKPLD